MSVKTRIEAIRKTNETFVGMMKNLSVEELNAIPEGFSNNIVWNFAHSLAVQQAFFYALSKLPYTVDETFISKYKKGTRPEGFIDEKEISDIIILFENSTNRFESDYEKASFKLTIVTPPVLVLCLLTSMKLCRPHLSTMAGISGMQER